MALPLSRFPDGFLWKRAEIHFRIRINEAIDKIVALISA
jgi:hypothetical protein